MFCVSVWEWPFWAKNEHLLTGCVHSMYNGLGGVILLEVVICRGLKQMKSVLRMRYRR